MSSSPAVLAVAFLALGLAGSVSACFSLKADVPREPVGDDGSAPPPDAASTGGDARNGDGGSGGDAEGADVDAGPPHVDSPVAAVDVVTLGSVDVVLGDGYDSATNTLSSPCTRDPSPELMLFDQTIEGTPMENPVASRLLDAMGGGTSPGRIGVDHRAEVAGFLGRAGATSHTFSVFSAFTFTAGEILFSGREAPAPDASTCGSEYVDGLDVGASVVWGVDIAFDHGADSEAVVAAYGPSVNAWFTRPDAAWIGAALAGKATMTLRALQIGGDGAALATIANATRCSFAAMGECATTLTAVNDYVYGPFAKALQTVPTAQVLGACAVFGFTYAKSPSHASRIEHAFGVRSSTR